MTLTMTSPATAAVGQDQRPWISYGRISKKKQGDGAGAYMKIGAQHDENTAYIHTFAPGAEVIRLQDNMSAWSPDVKRPDWEHALQLLAEGQAAGIVGWHADRLTRQPLQGEHLLAVCKQGGAQLHTTRGGHIANPTMFRIENALSANESDQKSARISMKHQLLAQQGAWSGGPRPYGYDVLNSALVINETEAHWVRWMAQGVLAGRSLHSLAQELNERGVTTAQGAQWKGPNLSKFLRRPMLAGLRQHRGQIVGKAQWQPILDAQTWEAVCNLLDNPERRTSKSQARRYLLAGVARCGECGGKLRGRSNGTQATAAAYFCQDRGCVSRRQDFTDAVVVAHVLARLSQVDARGLLTAPESADERVLLEARRDQLNGNLAAMAEQAVMGTITMDMLTSATKRIRQEVADLDDQLAQLAVASTRPQAALAGIAGAEDVPAVWASLDLDRQRSVVDVLCQVTVQKSPRKGAGFDPELITINWK